MRYVIKNKSGRKLVCSLADGSTLRLLPTGESSISEELLTDHVKSLAKGNLITLTVIQTPLAKKKEKNKEEK